MHEDIFDFEFDLLDHPIEVYMYCAPVTNHAYTYDCGLYGPISGLDQKYAKLTQTVEGHYLDLSLIHI